MLQVSFYQLTGDIHVFKKELEMEKKVKKEKKEEKELKIKKPELVNEEEIVFEKQEKRVVKFIALLSAFFATGLAILIFVFSIIACISVSNLSKEALINNNVVVTLVSKLNGYSIAEVQDLIGNMTSSFKFILFEIVIPTIAFVGAMLLIIALARRVIEFVSDIKYEKDLYNKKKLASALDIISILSVILLATLVIFNRPTIIIYLLIETLLCIIYLLFKRCVMVRKK